jgi:PEP-CTERM motif
MNIKSIGLITGLVALFSGTSHAFAALADFNLASSGYVQDSSVAGNLFEPVGLLLSSGNGLVTACGGQCLSAGAASYTGVITGSFVTPNTVTPSTVTSLTLFGVTNNASISLYDSGNNLIVTFLTANGNTLIPTFEGGINAPTYSYTGATAVSYFVDNLGFGPTDDGLIQATFTSVAGAVPEPATWAMMILGFVGIGAMAYRRRNTALRVA